MTMWYEMFQDSTSLPYSIACQIWFFQKQFQQSQQDLIKYQSKTQANLTLEEETFYPKLVQSLLGQSKTITTTTESIHDLIEKSSDMGGAIEGDGKDVGQGDSIVDGGDGKDASKADSADDKVAEEPIATLSSMTLLNTSLSKTYSRTINTPTAAIYTDCATLCELMGVPVFWTGDGTRSGGGKEHEAEAYAASLVKAGYADVVASEDSDVLLYDTVLLRGLTGGIRSSSSGGSGKKLMELVDGKRVRQALFHKDLLGPLLTEQSSVVARTDADPTDTEQSGKEKEDANDTTTTTTTTTTTCLERQEEEYDKLSKNMMLEFALLCGTDFNRTIDRIGPISAMRLLLKHGSISKILREEKVQPPQGLTIVEYERELRQAKKVFSNPPKVLLNAKRNLRILPSQDRSSLVEKLFTKPATESEREPQEDQEEEEEGNGTTTMEKTSESDEAMFVQNGKVEYDRQAVLEFLRSRNAFKSSLSRSQGGVNEDDFNDSQQISSMGVDYFSEKQVVATWVPPTHTC